MKQRFTLIGLMLLFSALTFGQNTVRKHEKLAKTKLEKQLKMLKSEGKNPKHAQKFKRNRFSSGDATLKSAQTATQCLDSTINYYWDDVLNEWNQFSKNAYIYDANGNFTLEIYYEWDTFSNEWVEIDREEFTYDSNGNIIQDLYYSLDEESSERILYDRIEYTYYASGNMKQEIYYLWDDDSNEWVRYDKSVYTYDNNGNDSLRITYVWDTVSNEWDELNREEFTYDTNGNNTIYLSYEWDDDSSKWVGSYKFVHTYDANGNDTLTLEYTWSYHNKKWDEWSKCIETYDANGNSILHINYDWGDVSSKWVERSKGIYGYDANGNPTLEKYYYWDDVSNDWVESTKYDFTYDLSYEQSDLIFPPFNYYFGSLYSEQIANKPLNFISTDWDADSESWVNYEKGIYYYADQSGSSVNDIETNNIEVYPNPVSDYLNFSFTNIRHLATFELFDTHGRKLMSKDITNKEQLNLRDFDNGIYFYNLYIDDIRQSGKLIKQ